MRKKELNRRVRDKRYRDQNKEKRIKYVQGYRQKYPERENAQKRAGKLRKDYCELCKGRENLGFHHIDYKNDEGFTACGSCHKLYCKEGRTFEESSRLYEENRTS